MNRPIWYVLENGIPRGVDLEEGVKAFQDHESRRIGSDFVTCPFTGEKVHVSTVFLGVDHGWGEGEPVLWESMVFGGKHDGYQERYRTLEHAEEGHRRILEQVFKEDIE